jgi:excisionase family DNA binding protein
MTRTHIEPELYSVSEAAVECRCSAYTIRRWIRNGDLESVVLPSGRRLVPRAALSKFQRIPARARPGQRSRARFTP